MRDYQLQIRIGYMHRNTNDKMPRYALLAIAVLIAVTEGAIISQSAIRDCSWGDDAEPKSPAGETCNKKMLISMVLGSGQVQQALH